MKLRDNSNNVNFVKEETDDDEFMIFLLRINHHNVIWLLTLFQCFMPDIEFLSRPGEAA